MDGEGKQKKLGNRHSQHFWSRVSFALGQSERSIHRNSNFFGELCRTSTGGGLAFGQPIE